MKTIRRKNHRIWLGISLAVLFIAAVLGVLVYAAASKKPSALPPVLALDNTGPHAPRYMGLTAASYTGNLGGPLGANAKCNAAYAGSHMCNQRELLKAGVTSLGGAAAWVTCDLYHFGGGTPTYAICDALSGSAWNDGNVNYTCMQWTDGTSGTTYGALMTSNGSIGAANCTSSYQLPCCES